MKVRIPRKFISTFLAGALGVTLLSIPKKVGSKEEIKTKNDTIVEYVIDNDIEEDYIEVNENNYSEEIIVDETKQLIEDNDFNNIELSYYVKALENAKIYSNTSTKSDKLGLLINGQTLPLICKLDNNWYEVEYDSSSAYIKSENLEIIKSYDLSSDIPKIDFDFDIDNYLNVTNKVEATSRVNIRKHPNTNCEKYGQLSKGESLSLVKKYNDEWYEVIYNGKTAYVFAEYVKEIKGYSANREMSDMVYTTSKTPLYDIDTKEIKFNIPKREVAEVYAMDNEYYLVSVNNTFGLVDKKYCQSLGDKYVIIDISSQNLKVYADDKLIIDTKVVTGKDSTPTYCGLFDVFKKEQNIYWKEFDVTVKYGLDFNRGIWIHDASWRKKFGGDIYHKDGSHGCVNIPKNVMPEIYENVDLGTPVLVKK